jgi:plasmid stabilization system protein ParE
VKEYTIRITKQAREHLRSIKDYISNELLAPEAAYNTIALLRKEIKSLSEMPTRIKLTDEEPWHSEGIHRMRVKNYYVYFWIDEENSKVQITAVIYVARDQAKQLEIMKME